MRKIIIILFGLLVMGLAQADGLFSITQDKGSALMSEYIDTLLSSENTFQVAWFSGEGWKRAISDGLIEIDAKIRQPSPSNPYGPYGPYNDEDYKDKDIAATYHFTLKGLRLLEDNYFYQSVIIAYEELYKSGYFSIKTPKWRLSGSIDVPLLPDKYLDDKWHKQIDAPVSLADPSLDLLKPYLRKTETARLPVFYVNDKWISPLNREEWRNWNLGGDH